MQSCSACDYTEEEIIDNLEYMEYIRFDTDNIQVEIDSQVYSGSFESNFRIDFLDENLGNPSLTDIKEGFLTWLNQYYEATCKVYYFDQANCYEFDDILNVELRTLALPSSQTEKKISVDKIYDESIVILNFDKKIKIFHKTTLNQAIIDTIFFVFTPYYSYIRKTVDDSHLNSNDLEKIFNYAKGIYRRNGYYNVNYIHVNEEQAENLQLNWYDGFLNIKRLPVENTTYGLAATDPAGIASKTQAYINQNNNIANQRKGESKFYSLGYLLAHETLHHMVYLTYHHFYPRDWTKYRNEGNRNHINSPANLNVDANVLGRNYGGIPLNPPEDANGEPHLNETILFEHKFWLWVLSSPYHRSN